MVSLSSKKLLGVFLKGSGLRSAGASADWVWSLIPRHLSWPISNSPTHGFLASFHIFLFPRVPVCSPSAGLKWWGELRRLTPQEPETLPGCNFPAFLKQRSEEGPALTLIPLGTKMGRKWGKEGGNAQCT